jgi:hypothetical protein
MVKEQEIAYWLFQLLVEDLEKMDEEERVVRRLEVLDETLDILMKSGEGFKVRVERADLDWRAKGESEMENASSAESNTIQISVEDWENLLEACEAVLNFLEYDQRKMRDVQQATPDFPWDKRAYMINKLADHLREALIRIDEDLG